MSTQTDPVSYSPVISEILPASAQHLGQAELVSRDPLARALDLPFTLTLEVPIVHFSVGALMELAVGNILETATPQNEDLPLRANGQLVGMVEIEVAGESLAVRLTGTA